MSTTALEQQLSLLARRISRPVRLHGSSGWTLLDRPAYQALLRIVEEGPLRPTALSALLEVDLSVVSRQIRSLEDAGFVSRSDDPADARATLIVATPAGLDAFEAIAQRRSEVLGEVLVGWPEEDVAEFVRMLTRFNTELEATVARRRAALEP